MSYRISSFFFYCTIRLWSPILVGNSSIETVSVHVTNQRRMSRRNAKYGNKWPVKYRLKLLRQISLDCRWIPPALRLDHIDKAHGGCVVNSTLLYSWKIQVGFLFLRSFARYNRIYCENDFKKTIYYALA